MINASLASGTWLAYQRSLERFMQFRNHFNLNQSWPAPIRDIALFMAYLSKLGYATSSVSTTVAAISFAHKVNGWYDPGENFLIKKIKEGVRRGVGLRVDKRLPISVQILENIVSILQPICSSQFEALLFKAASLLAFFALLRVSEYAAYSKKGDLSRMLQVGDVRLPGPKVNCVEIVLRFSKTDQRGAASQISISAMPGSILCPVEALSAFLACRLPGPGPLFTHFDRSPLTTSEVNHVIRECTKTLGLPSELFSSHSLRIGAATSAAQNGVHDEVIQTMGRWKSAAYQIYIRPQLIIKGVL